MPRRNATNQIQMALDRIGIDWHSPRYGRARVAGEASTIIIPDNGVFGELITPLRADGAMHLDGSQPPAIIFADAYEASSFWHNKAFSNLTRIEKIFSKFLGSAEKFSKGSNVTRTWKDQAGSITLTCWPDGNRLILNSSQNPDLKHACLIEIVSGWRRPLSRDEIKAINNMTVIGRGTTRGIRKLTSTPPSDHDIGYIREPAYEPSLLDAVIAIDTQSKTIIACPGKLMLIPLEKVKSIRHEAYIPGVLSGKSLLVATTYDGRDIIIAEHDDTHGLELISRALSKFLDVSIKRYEAIAS